MPWKAPSPCVQPGCGELAVPGASRCRAHQFLYERDLRARRPTATARGYGRAWQRFARSYLAAHPLCVRCGRPATDVDHLDGPTERFDPRRPPRVQALCHPCHSTKTGRERVGS